MKSIEMANERVEIMNKPEFLAPTVVNILVC